MDPRCDYVQRVLETWEGQNKLFQITKEHVLMHWSIRMSAAKDLPIKDKRYGEIGKEN